MQDTKPIAQSFSAGICTSLHGLFSDTDRVAVRRYEEQGSAELLLRLTPQVQHLLERASEAMACILEHYETQSNEEFDFESTENKVIAGDWLAPSPQIAIADRAFIAVTELRQHRQRLAAQRSSMAPQEIISCCGSALRAIKKCLYAVEPFLCKLENHAPLLPPRLATSLAVRRHYQKLWTFALSFGEVDERSIRRALRGAGTRIAILVGNDVYNLLREDDRFRLRDLQTRILGWLSAEEDPMAALRIWQDFALFVEMLRQINLREELIEHDREVMQEALGRLNGAPARVGREAQEAQEGQPAGRELLLSLIGLDDELDRLLIGEADLHRLIPVIQRLLHQQQDSSAHESAAS